MVGILDSLRNGDWLGGGRARVYPVLLFACLVATTGLYLLFNNGLLPNGSPFGADFAGFWVAANEALAGRPHVPYDRTLFEPAQKALFPESGFFSFSYPPYFLIYLIPFGLVSFWIALTVWLAATFAFAVWIGRRIVGARQEYLVLAITFPATYLNAAHGQNTFLAAGLFAGALLLLGRRPIAAGVLFGLLSFKPHLGLLVPIFLLAGGHWRAITSASATILALAALSAGLFGADIWNHFLSQGPVAIETLKTGEISWIKLISVYPGLRYYGAGHSAAMFAQVATVIAVAAIIFFYGRQSTNVSDGSRYALLIAGSLLATPHALSYELFLLGPVLAFWFMSISASTWRPYEKTLLALSFMSPLILFLLWSAGVLIGPLVPLFVFVVVLLRCRDEAAEARPATGPRSEANTLRDEDVNQLAQSSDGVEGRDLNPALIVS